MKKISLGRHLLIEYYGCAPQIINDKGIIRKAMLEAARLAGATTVTDIFHTFSPHGISGVIVISESHLAIHTWPEYGCASVDIFSCSDKLNLKSMQEYLREVFCAVEVTSQEVERGQIEMTD